MPPSSSTPSQVRPSTVANSATEPAWRVVAPSRLHFGLLGFHDSTCPFGGAGVMIDLPAAIVEVVPAGCWRVTGMAVSRAQSAALNWSRTTGRALGDLHLRVTHLVDQHVGLGSGTQLAMAVGQSLFYAVGVEKTPVQRLAASVNRGGRSSVGSLGFANGGFIFERGHADNDAQSIARDYRQLPIPADWRFVVCRPIPACEGIFGRKEQAAFDLLPPVQASVTDELLSIADEAMIPALRDEDVTAFGEAVYQYGRLAGSCFAKVQGGPFASQGIAAVVEAIRGFGVTGVGQSSWGPSVFAVLEGADQAGALCRWLDQRFYGELHHHVTSASESGAIVAKIAPKKAKAR